MQHSLPAVLITADFDPEVARELGQDFDLTVVPAASGSISDRVSPVDLAKYGAIICETDILTAADVAAAHQLRLVVSCRANPVNVDLDACRQAGIVVATTPARNADVTADLAFTLILTTVRRTAEAERWMRSGNWVPDRVFEPYATFRGMALTGRTLGLVGLGAVGRRVAERARAFGMDVIGYDPYADEVALAGLVRMTSLAETLAASDVVSIHAPLNAATTGMIGAAELALLKPTAYLINAGRAAIIDEAALIEVLRERRIAGAGFDVFWTEPPAADHPLLSLPGVVVTPHIGGASDDVVTNHSRQAAAALRAWSRGEQPPHVWA